MILNGTYVSGNARERLQAYQFGYRQVGHHPREIDPAGAGMFVIIDFDNVLYGDHDEALRLAHACAANGVAVGVQTNNPDDPRLLTLLLEWKIEVAKSHLRALVAMRKKLRSQIAQPVA